MQGFPFWDDVACEYTDRFGIEASPGRFSLTGEHHSLHLLSFLSCPPEYSLCTGTVSSFFHITYPGVTRSPEIYIFRILTNIRGLLLLETRDTGGTERKLDSPKGGGEKEGIDRGEGGDLNSDGACSKAADAPHPTPSLPYHPYNMSHMQNLPTELILKILSGLSSESSLAALALANRRFYEICNPHLYEYNVLHGNNSALDWAAENGQMATLLQALDAGAPLPEKEAKGPLVTQVGDDGPRSIQEIRPHPISLAAKGGHIHIVRYMLSRGVSITTADRGHLTPLALAARNADASLVKYLLSMGASTYYERGWRRALWQAAFHGHIDVVKLLVPDPRQDKSDPEEKLMQDG